MSKFDFDPIMIESLLGGLPSLEIPRLRVNSLEEATEFIRGYGFDLAVEEDVNKLWSYHRRAVTYVQGELLEENEKVPAELGDARILKDLCQLLLYASAKPAADNLLQLWSCAILKVMHILVHLDNDLFTFFSTEIQDQIIRPLESHVYSDPASGIWLGQPSHPDSIPLSKFNVKPFKTSDSSVTKYLAKPEIVAFAILDKIGIRFVTKHLFDVFRVMRYLVEHNLISFSHNVPDQSNNTLYPDNIFIEVMAEMAKAGDRTPEEIDRVLEQRLTESLNRAHYNEKFNSFTGKDYRFAKFITRRLVRIHSTVNNKPRKFTFFYPFEVQIQDYSTFLNTLSGPSSHEQYKQRQRQRARLRILGPLGKLIEDKKASNA